MSPGSKWDSRARTIRRGSGETHGVTPPGDSRCVGYLKAEVTSFRTTIRRMGRGRIARSITWRSIPGKTNDVLVELIEGVLVEGKVAEAATGKPVAGVFVGMYGAGSAAERRGHHQRDDRRERAISLPVAAGLNPLLHRESGWVRQPRRSPFPPMRRCLRCRRSRSERGCSGGGGHFAATGQQGTEKETVSVAGLVRDVADRPVGRAGCVVGRCLGGRQIKVTDRQGRCAGRFSFELPGRTGATIIAHTALQGRAGTAVLSINALGPAALGHVEMMLGRTRPFFGFVKDSQHRGIAGAVVRVERMKVPVPAGAGTMVAEVPWQIISGTPLEKALRATTDEQGRFGFEAAPARSRLDLVVTVNGVTVHRTSDFAQRGRTGRMPDGFDDGFLQGHSVHRGHLSDGSREIG